MVRFLLLLLFFIILAGDALGLNVSLAPGLSIKNLFLYVLFSWIAIHAVVSSDWKVDCLPVIVPFATLLAYAVFSWLVVVLILDYANYDALQNAIGLKSQLADSFFMLLVFLFGVTNAKDALWLYRMLIWMVVVSSIITIADAFGVPDLAILEWHSEGRLNGFLGQPNEFGTFLVFFLPATVALFVVETGIRRFFAAIGVLASFVCLLLTFSRGSYVGISLGLLAGAVLLRQYVPMRAVTTSIIALVVVSAIAVPLLFIAGFDEVFRDRFSLLGGDTHTMTTGRSTLWSRALSVMTESPISFLTGYGWNAYDSFREFRLSIHNTYLNYWFNLGLIGLALYLRILWAVIVMLRRGVASASEIDKAFLIATTFGFLGICITIFVAQVFTTDLLMWAFLGLTLRLAVTAEAGQKSTTESVEFVEAESAAVG